MGGTILEVKNREVGQILTDDAYGIMRLMKNIAVRSSAFVVRGAWVLNQVQDDMTMVGGRA